jgi:ATP-dependent RNA helicase DDX24/MAK5
LAVEIDSIRHQKSKLSHEVNWMRNMIAEMDVECDEETVQGKGYQKSSDELEKANVKDYGMKQQFSQLLKKPIMAPGMSGKFLTGHLDFGLIN